MAEKKNVCIELAYEISKKNKLIKHIFMQKIDAEQHELCEYAQEKQAFSLFCSVPVHKAVLE